MRRPLRIGIDALFVRPGVNGGGETYLRNLLPALASVDRRNRYYVFVTPRNRKLLSVPQENFTAVVCPIPAGGFEVYARLLWEWTALRWQARRHRLDLMHFPANLLPPRFPVRTVLTTHDFSTQFYQENFPSVHRTRIDRLFAGQRVRSCVSATRVVTDSEFTRREALRRSGAPSDRVETVYLATPPLRRPSPTEARATVARYGVCGRFLLAVATRSLHKNLPRLLEAFAAEAFGALAGHGLVLVGRPGTGAGDLSERIRALGLSDRVVLTGYVPDEELPAFYVAADVFVFPSLYEGFGIPLLEAASLGTPVVAARAASLPEVGGPVACYVNPLSAADLARGLVEVATDETRKRTMSEQGRKWAARWSWEGTAEKMVGVYRRTVMNGLEEVDR